MLKRVHFAGIKSLLDVTVELEPFTVLVGPNGCGKSTLLDQIELVVQMCRADQGSHNVFGMAGEALKAAGLRELRTINQESNTTWLASDEQRQISMEIPAGSEGGWHERARIDTVTPAGQSRLTAAANGEERVAFTARLAQHFTWRAQRLALSPREIAAPSRVEQTELEADGFGLPTILKDLAGNDTSAFLLLQEDLRKVVPQFRELRFGKGTRNGDPTVILDLLMQQGKVPAHRVSDGTLIALALLTATHNSDLPRLILMDDIDHGLHLSAQIEMVDAIRRVMAQRPDLQVICTTHSPVLLDRFAIGEVRVMALDSQGYTRIKPLAQHPELDAWRAGMSTGELWANLGEEWVTRA